MNNLRYRCTIHNCTFGIEAPENPTPQIAEDCLFMECPICIRKERRDLQEKLALAHEHLNKLLEAIEIKQSHLVTKV